MAAPPRMGLPPAVPLQTEVAPEQPIRRAPPVVPVPVQRMEPEPEPEPTEDSEVIYDIGEPDTYEVS